MSRRDSRKSFYPRIHNDKHGTIAVRRSAGKQRPEKDRQCTVPRLQMFLPYRVERNRASSGGFAIDGIKEITPG